MVKILIVEDNSEKLQKITQVLLRVEGINIESIISVSDARNAQLKLIDTSYDLLILDIAIPGRIDQEVEANGGVKLLEEVMTRDRFKVPDHIVGITAYPEILTAVRERFSLRLLTIVFYDPNSDEWERSLEFRARHLVQSKQAQKSAIEQEYLSYLAVVCALESPELEAVLRLKWQWQQIQVPGDPTIYHHGQFQKDNETKHVYAAAAPRMGMPAASILAMKMISAFRPHYIAMTGIAAGIPDKARFGDVIVADPSWDWGSGKWTLKNDELSFSADQHQLHFTPELRRKFNLMASDKVALSRIKESWPADKPSHDLNIKVGPLASGAAVLADGSLVEMIKHHQRKVLGVDMETYGVFAAAEEASTPRPEAFSMKSVVDFGDPTKDDKFQKYAAFSSAEALRYFVEAYL
jgi:nucleoside phosphorylase